MDGPGGPDTVLDSIWFDYALPLARTFPADSSSYTAPSSWTWPGSRTCAAPACRPPR
jgi:hypothetical protein